MSESGIFKAAVKLAPDQRAKYLDEACGGNRELRRDVESLLKAHESSESFIEASPAAVATIERQPPERPGMRIGRYRLLEQIGEGGMGTVWVAEQTEPVKRRVALKLIKPGMDSRQVLSRFEAERQALALMDHPNIAKVYDGGMTDEGRPFFVMEYVKGMPITEYCDRARLSIQERLKLFIPVCQAVQHAHQKGVIHRDLKPSNILVCLYDGQPVPKVIDFGLAKAMHQPLTEHTLYTAHGLMVGTPIYMSPEQAEFNNLDVDTRTDIYSLGVILYELLTGTTPLEKKQFKDAAFQEILRLIKDVEPQRPSLKISSLSRVGSAHQTRNARDKSKDGGHSPPYTSSLEMIAAQRSLEPAQLSRAVKGDLDWIVMKSLEKERSRRYETASGLARDVERYLVNEPVKARPPSSGYRLKKFAQRNKTAVITGLSIVALLLVGTIVSSVLAVRATRAERRAQQNLAKAREAVQQMLTRVADERLAFIPQVEDVRLALLQDALTFYEQLIKETNADPQARFDAASAYLRLSSMEATLGTGKGKGHARAALDIMQGLCTEYPRNDEFQASLADSHHSVGRRLAWNSATAAQLAEATPHYEEAIRIRENLIRGSTRSELHEFRQAECYQDFATALTSQAATLPNAVVISQKAVDSFERLVKRFPQSPEYLASLGSSCYGAYFALSKSKQRDAARSYLQKAIAIFERLESQDLLTSAAYARLQSRKSTFASYRHDLAWATLRMAAYLEGDGDLEAAREMYLKAVARCEKDFADFPRVTAYRQNVAVAQCDLARFFNRSGEFERAVLAWKRALELPWDDQIEKAINEIYMALALERLNHKEEAQAIYEKVLRLESGNVRGTKSHLAGLLAGIAHYHRGEWDASVQTLERSMQSGNNGGAYTFFYLAMANWQMNHKADATRWYSQAVEWMDARQAGDRVLMNVRAAAEDLLRPALDGRAKQD